MLKRYSSYLVVLLLWVGIGFAQTWSQTPQEQFDMVKQMNYLNQVGVYFVNEITNATPKEYSLTINQWESKELTLLLKNESDKNLHVRVKFADQALSNAWTRWCLADYENWFSRFVTAPRESDILLPAKSQMTKKIELKFPVWIESIQKWCIAYGVTEDLQKNTKSALSIITRKVLFLDALIWWTRGTIWWEETTTSDFQVYWRILVALLILITIIYRALRKSKIKSEPPVV